MKKSLSIFVVIILFLSGLSATALYADNSTEIKYKEKNFKSTISTPLLSYKEFDNEFIEVDLKDTSTYLMTPGKPMLPKLVKTIELPFGIRNIKIDVKSEEMKTYEINNKIRPAPAHIPLIENIENFVIKNSVDEEIYESNELYPSKSFDYKIGCGLNSENERVTFVSIHFYPIRYIPTEDILYITENADIKITYKEPLSSPFVQNGEYDMVIIAPSIFSIPLQRLIRHKNNYGVTTILKKTQSIYREYPGVDRPEQIKFFIKDAIENLGVKYVLLVGGLKSIIRGRAKDDLNQGSKGWYVPVRYNNLFDDPEHPLAASSIYDPGVITDLYYSDIYEVGGNFSSWDPNGDGNFAVMGRPGLENDTDIDMFPDVGLGRLACRNIREVQIMVNKIIRYEKQPADPYWFNKMIVVSGDGFLDQQDLDFQWNVTDLPNGRYTIYAQSNNPEGVFGLIDIINVTIDRTRATDIMFSHDDHLKIDGYPFPPVAEITSPSEGSIIGSTDFFYEPGEGQAYCNSFTGWANVSYENGIMHIRGKSYDPQPYGNITDIHVWIKNNDGTIVFSDWRNDTEMYYEGEWVTGDKELRGNGGALYHMPDHFDREILWTSNGRFTDQDQVIDALSQGSGFVFFSGHGSPRTWGDHFPGVPGNRGPASVTGLSTIKGYGTPPYFPMNRISNYDRPFILVVGGCHNSQFNVSVIPSFLDRWLPLYMWTYGGIAPECWSWWITRLPRRGAIASIGNTGLGYGTLGKDCTIGGLDGGISLEFFKQYSKEGHHVLGDAYCQTQTYYASTFDMTEDDHIKSLQQWVLLGDPSLMIGGYST